MTGGLDSRLLLAILLAAGERPRLFVCGQEDAFDLVVAQDIAKRLGLTLVTTSVTRDDFLESATMVARATNGLLPVTHWPGVLFAKHVPPGSTLVLGLNGEIARSYYDDQGFSSLMRSLLGSHSEAGRKLWSRRLHRGLTEADRGEVHPALMAQCDYDTEVDRAIRLMGGQRKLGDGLDEAFRFQYGRHKTGADLSALSVMTPWIAPLCSPSWADQISHLARHWRLGSAFHRYAIGRLAPDLLSFPEETSALRTLPRFPPLQYWLGLRRGSIRTPFFDQSVYEDPALIECVRQVLPSLNDIISTELQNSLGSSPLRRRLFFQLGAVAFWRRDCLNRVGSC